MQGERNKQNKQTKIEHKNHKPQGFSGRAPSQPAIYFLLLQKPQEQAYQGTDGATDRIYPTGVVMFGGPGNQWTAAQRCLCTGGDNQSTVLTEETAGVQREGLNKEGGYKYLGEAADSSSCLPK